jgi:hypothetical protein
METLMNPKFIDEAVQQVIRAYRAVARVDFGGGGWTLAPDSPRLQVLRVTNQHGVGHLRELAAALEDSARHYSDRTSRLVDVDNIVDLNAGAGLNGIALALLAQVTGRNPTVCFVDHSVEALNVALEVANLLGIHAVGHLVKKRIAESKSSDVAALESVWLEPEFPPLIGNTLVFAGHALSIWIFDRSVGAANRQRILEAQNTAVLHALASQLDPSAPCYVADIDVGTGYAHGVDFILNRLTQITPRAIATRHRCYPPNQTPGDNRRPKNAFFVELGPALVPASTPGDDLVWWPTLDTEIAVTATELAALIGDVQSCSGTVDSTPLDEVLSSLVMS